MKPDLGRLSPRAFSHQEQDARLSRREMLAVTGLFVLAAPVLMRTSEAAAGVIKAPSIPGEPESEFTKVPFKPDEDEAEAIDVSHRRRRRRHRRRRHRRHGDDCFWSPFGIFCW
jgi:hypothetical protein